MNKLEILYQVIAHVLRSSHPTGFYLVVREKDNYYVACDNFQESDNFKTVLKNKTTNNTVNMKETTDNLAR